ncbi:PepSY domain-containing protein [Halobacillus sp. BBL2006]|uniref:PepSY domain-containing protein n=1 Tax=Halobacillus sp. BBL2006 TaxID=1543706 RepID=UPI00068E975C|nr:PepSY domain-containing protein [Halobacillus sp. BBL2006]
MKKKLIIGGITGAIVLGGAFGVNAMTNHSDDWNGQDAKLSQDEAEKAAKEELQGLTIDKVEKDKEGDRLIYEVEGTTEDGKESEIGIDANSGEVVKSERDEDSEESENNADVKISKEKAEEIAKKEGKGQVVEVELDDGHYEVEMKDG